MHPLTDTEVYQETHYYPFGMTMEGEWQDIVNGPENKYLYNGKELNKDFGLDWIDYGMRMYDPSVGRWNAVDLLSEITYNWTPYNYVQNTPINAFDPDGMLCAGCKDKDEWKPSYVGEKKPQKAPSILKNFPNYIASGPGVFKRIRNAFRSAGTWLKSGGKWYIDKHGVQLTTKRGKRVRNRTRLVSFTFYDNHRVNLFDIPGTTTSRLTTNLPEGIFDHWKVESRGLNDEGTIDAINGSSTNRTVNVRVTALQPSRGYAEELIRRGSFDAVSKTIYASIPRGFLGRYKWKKGKWNVGNDLSIQKGKVIESSNYSHWKNKID